MSYFFLYRPPTVSWLPAPVTMDLFGAKKKRKKGRKLAWTLETLKREKRRKEESEFYVLMELFNDEDTD